MLGVFEIRDSVPIGDAIEALLMIVEASEAEEWANKVTYLPFPKGSSST